MLYYYGYQSPLGNMLLASDGEALTGLWFEGQKYFGAALPKDHENVWKSGKTEGSCCERIPVFEDTIRWLDLYFQGKIPDFIPRIHLKDSPFRMAVWEILLTIPYGQTMTYGEIAEIMAARRDPDNRIGGHKTARMSAQAVGGAVGHNPISVIVPCHRVLGAGKKLTGYAGGLERKQKLLELENIHYCAD